MEKQTCEHAVTAGAGNRIAVHQPARRWQYTYAATMSAAMDRNNNATHGHGRRTTAA